MHQLCLLYESLLSSFGYDVSFYLSKSSDYKKVATHLIDFVYIGHKLQ